MHLKVSKYNITFKEKDYTLLYNSFTGAKIKLPGDFLWLEQKDSLNLESLSNFDIKILKENGVLIDEYKDELDEIKKRQKKAVSSTNELNLTIMLTSKCNFRCTYCFQSEKSTSIDDMLANSIIKFINSKLAESNEKRIKIVWFGGEPLLLKKYISYITNNINHTEELTSEIYTNGYLLDSTFIKSIHDSRRMLENGKGTYDKIIKNLRLLVKKNSPAIITVTSVLDKQNVDLYPKLVEDLFLFKDKIHMDFSFTNSYDGENPDILDRKEIAHYEKKYYSLLKEKGVGVINEPRIIPISCIAENINSFFISPDKNIYKCMTASENKESKIGELNYEGEAVLINDKFNSWVDNSLIISDECVDCNLLPLCMGGCPLVRLGDHPNENEDVCYYQKDRGRLKYRIFGI